jgi:Cysteine rich repeat
MQHARLVAALLLAMLPLAALAQSTDQPSSTTAAPAAPSPAVKEARVKMRTACAADLQKFCATVERGKGALVGCLRTHGTELSPECTSARAALRATRLKEKN